MVDWEDFFEILGLGLINVILAVFTYAAVVGSVQFIWNQL
jgi:hypothetical protein